MSHLSHTQPLHPLSQYVSLTSCCLFISLPTCLREARGWPWCTLYWGTKQIITVKAHTCATNGAQVLARSWTLSLVLVFCYGVKSVSFSHICTKAMTGNQTRVVALLQLNICNTQTKPHVQTQIALTAMATCRFLRLEISHKSIYRRTQLLIRCSW